MKLKVIEAKAASPWYAKGLNFTCTGCGNCCTGGPGYVWISREEIVKLADHLKLAPDVFVDKYCRKIDGQFSLRERRTREGNHDCIFLEKDSGKTTLGPDGQLVSKPRGCTVYPVRPLQCRTWPFWPENLKNRIIWNRSAKRCHGMNAGDRHFTKEQIEALRDAKEWPENPPSSL